MNDDRTAEKVSATLLTLVLSGFILLIGKAIFLPLIVAFLLCSLAQPLVRTLQRRGVPWSVTVLGLMLALVVVLVWVGGNLYESGSAYLNSLPGPGSDETATPGEPLDLSLESLEKLLGETFQGSWNQLDAGRVIAELKSFVPRLAGLFGAAALTLFGVMNNILLVLFFMLFIFAEQNVSRRKIIIAAGARREEVEAVLSAIARDVHRYLSVKTAISLLTGVLCGLGLWALGVPYAALFGLLTFLLNYIPTFGSILAGLFPMVVAWVQTDSFGVPMAVIVLYGVVNMVLGNVIEPRVLGKQLNLSPLVILMAVAFWAALWGVPGMFLAVPLTRTVQLVFWNLPSLRPVAILMSNGEEST